MSSTPPINNAEIAAGNSNSRVANRINCLGLNHLNWLNIISFVLNVIVTYGVGTMGWFGAKTNSELSDKYQVGVNSHRKKLLFLDTLLTLCSALFIRFVAVDSNHPQRYSLQHLGRDLHISSNFHGSSGSPKNPRL